ncbi:hypothetical protein [Streptomyces sp. NPDC058755]
MTDDDPLEPRRPAQETRSERQVSCLLACFLFGFHIVAFVMSYTVRRRD